MTAAGVHGDLVKTGAGKLVLGGDNTPDGGAVSSSDPP
jgi:autotransporter-associated beta strand protein